MSLRKLAATVPPQRASSATCSIADLRAQLKGDDLAWLDEQLADDRAQGTWIARVLKANGHDMKAHNLQRHRRGECKCP